MICTYVYVNVFVYYYLTHPRGPKAGPIDSGWECVELREVYINKYIYCYDVGIHENLSQVFNRIRINLLYSTGIL